MTPLLGRGGGGGGRGGEGGGAGMAACVSLLATLSSISVFFQGATVLVVAMRAEQCDTSLTPKCPPPPPMIYN